MNYILNIEKIRELSRKAGFSSLGELCLKAKVHRNSITPYIKQQRSPFTQVVLDIAKTLNVKAIDLVTLNEDENILEVKKILTSILNKEQAVFLFGSRSRNTQKKFSDMDLGITGGSTKIDFSTFSKIKAQIEDAFDNFPISLNVINLDLAPLDFLLEIEADLKIICGSETVASYFQGYLNGRKKN